MKQIRYGNVDMILLQINLQVNIFCVILTLNATIHIIKSCPLFFITLSHKISFLNCIDKLQCEKLQCCFKSHILMCLILKFYICYCLLFHRSKTFSPPHGRFRIFRSSLSSHSKSNAMLCV